MTPIFLISSAIKTKFGVYAAEQRLQQTRDTINSIKTKVPNARTVIVECSGGGIDPDQLSELSQMADYVIDLTTDPQIVALYNSTDNWDIVKNGSEILCFLKAFNVLRQNPNITDGYDRIFKMSGRYKLNDSFDLNFYDDVEVKGKIVIGKRRASQFPPNLTQQPWQYMSRLWSWPTPMLIEIMDVYSKSMQFFSDRINQKGYIDIEHLLAKFLDQSKVLEVDVLGVEGNIAPNGNAVKD